MHRLAVSLIANRKVSNSTELVKESKRDHYQNTDSHLLRLLHVSVLTQYHMI